MDYLDMEPSITPHYYRIILNCQGQPEVRKCEAFGADIEVAVATDFGAECHEVIDVRTVEAH